MSSWAERAKAAIAQTGQGGTAKTDETVFSRLLAVSSVPTVAAPEISARLSSVLAVPSPAILEKPADWHALDAAYLSHHFNCPVCIAAGRGSQYGLRCDTGAALWCAYAQADQPGGKICELTQNED
ncbi:MAG: hypothetical protein KBF98_15470 [Rhodoferax sp.]|nr:hypothetical protein [Rhodoferax sp.]